jgi:hypothetical protein
MPLKDHFHPPLAPRRLWNSFVIAWATSLASGLNRDLPESYYAEPHREHLSESGEYTIDVHVFRTGGNLVLAGCIELVSPSNKDRPAEREAFVTKCANYLHEGAGLLVVDVVTERQANLHAALVARLAPDTEAVLDAHLYASAYRPERRQNETLIRVWREALALGEPLPTMPLWLKDGPCMAVRLEATYDQTCRQLRIVKNGALA